MIDEGSITNYSGDNVFVLAEQRIAHERFIDRSLLDLYKEHRHEASVTQEIHEVLEREVEAPDATEIIRKILIELEAAVVGRNMIPEDRTWLLATVNTLHTKLDEGTIAQEDFLATVLLVRDLLFRLYPGKTIFEIEKALDMETIENSLREEQREGHYSREEREARMREAALELYSARYDWGYYPELREILGLTGNKVEDEKKIRAQEAEFMKHVDRFVDEKKAAGEDAEKGGYYTLIAKKMKQGTATLDEEVQVKLENNKLRMQWFTKFLPAFEELAVYGEDNEFVDLWQRAWKLAKRAEAMREIVSPEDRREREEQLKVIGRDTEEAVSKHGVRKEEVDEGNALIDETLMIMYPEIIEAAQDGSRSVNKEKLEEILGIKKA